jgi:hypothetical protein
MQIQNPTLVDLREFRKHIEVDARQRRNKFNLFPAWKYMFSMVISTLPWSQGLQRFMLTMLTQACSKEKRKKDERQGES